MNNNYRRGRQKEYQLKDRFENEGYVVFRTAGSHGIADLILIKPNKTVGKADLFPEIRFVQVKAGKNIKKEYRKVEFINHLQVEFFYLPMRMNKSHANIQRQRPARKKKIIRKKS